MTVSPALAFKDLTTVSRFTVRSSLALESFLNQGLSQVVRRLQRDIYNRVTKSTPFLTGHSQSGWVPRVSALTLNSDPRPDKKTARANAPGRLAANDKNSDRIARSYLVKNGNVFISNTVPYIGELNNGSSPKAPRQFVQTSIMVSVQTFK